MSEPNFLQLARAETSRTYSDLNNRKLSSLLELAVAERKHGHGNVISYSPKVFIPFTRLCRDVCSYCTFAHSPKSGESAYLSSDEVLAIARAGEKAGCSEALFTLGEMPEQRYEIARQALIRVGHQNTISYVAQMAKLVQQETGLLAHVNAGVMAPADLSVLRGACVSQGLMLESSSERLCEKGGPHYGSPGKRPATRIKTISEAGRLNIPFTTGILIGIGETRFERIESLIAIKLLHEHYGHIQEVIVQNFRAKPGTRMASAKEPDFEDLLWTAAVARIILGPNMSIQVPPNLSNARFPELLNAGINDWGGVSPVTPDHVNPEAPWPAVEQLQSAVKAASCILTARLAIYPDYLKNPSKWVDPGLLGVALRASDGEGYARTDKWSPGLASVTPKLTVCGKSNPTFLDKILRRASSGEKLSHLDVISLFQARGGNLDAVVYAADSLRKKVSGETVRYVVNRNINYTNMCGFHCAFCAFSKGKTTEKLRGKPYNVSLEEVARRAMEARGRGATEVCMQGGIHPDFTGETYLDLLRSVKNGVPDMHVHAFSPLEVFHGASTLNISIERFLCMLRDAGLGSLPGTAAEILDDDVRAILCPDKLSAHQWLEVVETAHRVGLRTTATIMFGHVDCPKSWAQHLLKIRSVQERTRGFTEFVPLPFVHMEAPLYYKGLARKGPTFRETVLMHAVARLVLHPLISNIQVSWVKVGESGSAICLNAGANDLGGTLMNESISRAAGTEHGQELSPKQMDVLIRSIGRSPQQRTTLYRPVNRELQSVSYDASPLAPLDMGYLKRDREIPRRH